MGRLKAMPSRLAAPAPRLGCAPGDERGRDAERAKLKPWRTWYTSKRWKNLRRKILTRDGYTCRQTGVALSGISPAPHSPVIDHIQPHNGDPALFWDESNLQAVSKAWHDSEKQRQERAAGA